MAAEPEPSPERYAQTIVARLAAAGCRLRHDKVARRLVEGVQAAMAPDSAGVIVFAITAPIRHPAKTLVTLVPRLASLPAEGLRAAIHGNTVHARRVAAAPRGITGVFGFVHHPDRDGSLVLDLAAAALTDE